MANSTVLSRDVGWAKSNQRRTRGNTPAARPVDAHFDTGGAISGFSVLCVNGRIRRQSQQKLITQKSDTASDFSLNAPIVYDRKGKQFFFEIDLIF